MAPLRVRLLSMLGAVVALVCASWSVARYYDHRRAWVVAQIEALPHLHSSVERRGPAWLERPLDAIGLRPWDRIVTVTCQWRPDVGRPLRDDDLCVLSQIDSLEDLELCCSEVTDAGLALLAPLTRLSDINLMNTKVTDAGLVHLGQMPLYRLALDSTEVTGSGLASLGCQDTLGVLTMTGTNLDDEGLRSVTRFRALTYLRVGGQRITDAGLGALLQLKNLRHLAITEGQMGEEVAMQLAALPQLSDFCILDPQLCQRVHTRFSAVVRLEKSSATAASELYAPDSLTWKCLGVMNEPPLEPGRGEGQAEEMEVYRFLWLRTFHHPIAVRVTKTGEQASVVVKELDGKAGYRSGKLVLDKSRTLAKEEWSEIARLIEESAFWKTPVEKAPDPPPPPGFVAAVNSGKDGADWIVEGRRGGKYHIVERWCPRDGAELKYRELCLRFLRLAGFDLSKESVY